MKHISALIVLCFLLTNCDNNSNFYVCQSSNSTSHLIYLEDTILYYIESDKSKVSFRPPLKRLKKQNGQIFSSNNLTIKLNPKFEIIYSDSTIFTEGIINQASYEKGKFKNKVLESITNKKVKIQIENTTETRIFKNSIASFEYIPTEKFKSQPT